MSIVLAIDIGTSSAKALAVDQNGREDFSTAENYLTHHPQPDYSEQNPEEIFQAVKKIIHACPKEIKEQVSAISLSSAMHSLMAVDEQGVAGTPLILWSDLRSKTESRQAQESPEGIAFAVKTGTPIHPMSPFCKLLWLKKNQGDVFQKAYKFIGIKEFIWHKFFDCFEIDHGIASATGLFETGKLKWYAEALEKAGVNENQLSKPVSVYHNRLLTDASLLTQLGFSTPVRFVIGSSDGCLANLGSYAMDSRTLSITIGTSGAVRRVAQNNSHPNSKIFRYHLDEETLIEGGATNNGAILLEWFSTNFLKEKIDVPSFIQRAMQIPAGAEGLIFLPYVFGERAPLYDPDASGVFFGVKHHHTTAHFMRAILEGIGFALLSIAELIEGDDSYISIVASGGFAKSDSCVQLLSDIFGKPIRVNQNENASALGAAMIGFKAIKEDYSFPAERVKEFMPDKDTHLVYKKSFIQFKNLGKHIQPVQHASTTQEI